MKSQWTEQFFIARSMLLYFAFSVGHNTKDHYLYLYCLQWILICTTKSASKNLKWNYTWSYLLQVECFKFGAEKIAWETKPLRGRDGRRQLQEKISILWKMSFSSPAYLRDSCILLFPLPHLSTRWQVMPNYFGISYCIVSFHHLPMPVAHQAWEIKRSNLLEIGKKKKKNYTFQPKIEKVSLY